MSIDLGEFGSLANADDAPACDERALWRYDPEESYSDWTLIVKYKVNDSDYKEETYHVHKSALATGPRRSQYFAKMFQASLETKENVESKCTLEVLEEAAYAVPDLLDFLYGEPSSSFKICWFTAVPLRFWANYLGIEELFKETSAFIQSHMNSIYYCTMFLRQASIFQDEKVLHASYQCCVEEFNSLAVGALSPIPLELFQDISLNADCDSMKLSQHVAIYCWRNADHIDKDFLSPLATVTKMPKVDLLATPLLLKFALETSLDSDVDHESSLVSRCIKAMENDMKEKKEGCGLNTLESKQAFRSLDQELQIRIMKRLGQIACNQPAGLGGRIAEIAFGEDASSN